MSEIDTTQWTEKQKDEYLRIEDYRAQTDRKRLEFEMKKWEKEIEWDIEERKRKLSLEENKEKRLAESGSRAR